MTAVDYVVNLVLSGILIVGAYQFYFFTQRHPLRSAREFLSPLDKKFHSFRGGRGYTAFCTIRRFCI